MAKFISMQQPINRVFRNLLMALVFIPASLFGQSNVIDQVIAVVGDRPLLKSEIEYQHQQELMQGSNYVGDMKCHIMEQMLIQNLLLEQARLDSIEVGENQVIMTVDRQINDFINRAGSREKLEEWLNKSILQIKAEQRELVRNQMLTQQMQSKITGDVSVTPLEIRNFFRETDKDSLPYVPAQFELQKISLYPLVSREEIDRVKGQLRDFQKQISEGRDFATLAVLYSEDPISAARGGELGMTPRSNLVPEFARVAFNLQDKNKVSKVVETEFGFHIIQLIDRQGDRINVRHILIKPKPSQEAVEQAKARADSLANFIRQDSISFEEAALRFSMDKDTRASGGVMINPRTQSTKFELQEIEPSITRVVEGMKEGDVSNAFAMKDDRLGKDQFTVIKIKSKTQPHQANIGDDYQMIKSLLENKKSEKAFKSWIAKKQKETYISIIPEWLNCDFEFDGWVKN